MVGAEHGGLHLQELVRIAHMAAQAVRHLCHRLEHTGEDFGVHLQHHVVRVADVKINSTVVGIHHHLDRVAHVVDAASQRLGVGQAVGVGVGINDPFQLAFVVHHHVGISIKTKKRRQLLDPLADVPVVEYSAFAGDIRRQHNLFGSEMGGKKRFLQQRVNRYTALAVVGGVDVPGGCRVTEFRHPGLDDDVVVGQFAKVDFRAGDLDVCQTDCRNILDIELRQPFFADPADRPHGDAVTVSKDQPLVDPVFAG